MRKTYIIQCVFVCVAHFLFKICTTDNNKKRESPTVKEWP